MTVATDKDEIKVILEGEEEQDQPNPKPDKDADKGKNKDTDTGDEDDDPDDDDDASGGNEPDGKETPAKKDDDDGESEDDPEQVRDARRTQRRDERRQAKERARNAKAARERELRDLRTTVYNLSQQVRQLTTKAAGTDVATYDRAITGAKRAYDAAKAKLAKAVEEADGKGAATAQEEMLDAQQALAKFSEDREKLLKQIPSEEDLTKQTVQTPAVDPAVRANINIFMQRHDWYDAKGQDPDSRIIVQIDQQIADEGYDPRTKAYWIELEKRASRRIPHRFINKELPVETRSNAKPANGNGAGRGDDTPNVGGSSNGSGGGQGKDGVYHLSKDRIAAIKEANMWDDPKQRKAMIDSFIEYDKQHAKGAR